MLMTVLAYPTHASTVVLAVTHLLHLFVIVHQDILDQDARLKEIFVLTIHASMEDVANIYLMITTMVTNAIAQPEHGVKGARKTSMNVTIILV